MPLSIVMPCYNEEDIIEKTIRICYREIIINIEDSEFIIVNDCSTDRTAAVLDRLKNELPKLVVLKTPCNSGHGKAVRFGYESATKEYVFQIDSDNQFEASDFWKLYPLRDRYPFILGFRKKRHDDLSRLILTKIVCIVDFVIFGVLIKDANCPFRLIKKEILDKLLKEIDRDALAPNIMLSILAKKKWINVKEVPVSHHRRKTGSVSIARMRLVKFAIRCFIQLLRTK